jgi:oligosaccharide reducing-end xylanase
MTRRLVTSWLLCLGFALALLPSCKTTLDSVGCTERTIGSYDGGAVDGGTNLAPLMGPLSYPNAFRDLLGVSESDINDKINATFDQLFHGDPTNQAIYYTIGPDQAVIRDTYHGDIRTEGIGLGMMIAVELDKRDEFDRLWRYTKANLQVSDGDAQGYFQSFCTSGKPLSCYDPFGLQEITMALLLARGRWQGAPGDIDYAQEAHNLLGLMRFKDANSCGIRSDVTGTFDPKSNLVYNTPTPDSANISRPSLAMPAFYELWGQATGDPFWAQAATAARAYWKASANPTTGLIPEQAYFNGKSVPGFDTFEPEGDRALINMALDSIWFGNGRSWEADEIDESNRLLRFFYGQGLDGYGKIYSLDGSILSDPVHDPSLVAANGAIALISTNEHRAEFINAVWDMPLLIGAPRYYMGLISLTSMLLLSGRMQVY